MQTFLPYADFQRTARALDDRRLGKQRVEALQILRALTVPGYAWQHHPAVLMWKGYEEGLVSYGMAVCREWRRRGFSDTVEEKLLADAAAAGVRAARPQAELARDAGLPPWLGDERLHRSHQSALLRKDPGHYRPEFPDVPDDLDYHWPVRIEPTRRSRGRKTGQPPGGPVR